MTTTPSSIPVSFSLNNADGEQVLYITDDVAGQTMSLEITNTSAGPITPLPLSGPVSATNNHFELVFAPGVLYNNPTAVTVGGSGFEMFLNKDESGAIVPDKDDGTLSLYLSVRDPLTMKPGEKVAIPLDHLRADGQGGAHGTRLVLKYQNLDTGSDKPKAGERMTTLNIFNHQGQREIPLHAGLLGTYTVLNDGKSPNTLKFRLTNTTTRPQEKLGGDGSQVALVLEGGNADQEWTLGTNDQLANIVVKVTYPKQQPVEVGLREGFLEWPIEFKPLAQGEFIDVEISNLVTAHSGLANLYLRYSDIPGYWNGVLALTVLNSPLVVSGKNIGVGTSNLRDSLTLAPVAGEGGLAILSPSAGNSAIPWHDDIHYFTGKAAVFRLFGSAHNTYDNIVRIDFQPEAANDNEALVAMNITPRFQDNGKRGVKHYGLLVADGNVGIGTTTPGQKLSVAGDVGITGNTTIGAANAAANLTVMGNVGIGTTTPGQKLSVAGNVGITGNATIGTANAAANLTVLGNVGIGTATPGQKLSVAGDVGITGNTNIGTDSATAYLTVLGNVGIGMGSFGNTKLCIKPEKDMAGIHLVSETFGNTDLPWTDGVHYITGPAVVFRYFDPASKGYGNRVRLDLTNNKVIVGGDFFVEGDLNFYWSDLGAWKRIQNLSDGWAGSADARVPKPDLSDGRLKTGLCAIPQALDKVLRLHGRHYEWNEAGLSHLTRDIERTLSAGPDATAEDNEALWTAEREKAYRALRRPRLGLVAQEVESVVPELVEEDGDGYKHLHYQQLTGLLVEAIKEQQGLIQNLLARLAVVEARA